MKGYNYHTLYIYLLLVLEKKKQTKKKLLPNKVSHLCLRARLEKGRHMQKYSREGNGFWIQNPNEDYSVGFS